MSILYRLGTRDSALAMVQARRVKTLLEKICYDDKIRFEIVPLKTIGDVQTQVPLWQIPGEGFFTKELDTALTEKSVDFVVHSYKDLGFTRPSNFCLAAVSRREYPYDILLLRTESAQALLKGQWQNKEFIIGTSSPRRTLVDSPFLEKYFSLKNPAIKVTTKNLRGNVPSRLRKLLSGDYDATIMALAGLERLALNDQEALPSLEALTYLVLPLSECPPAPAQGALAIECRSEEKDKNSDLFKLLTQLNDRLARFEIGKEKEIFHAYGGGCHLPLGVYAKSFDDFYLINSRGVVDGKTVLQRDIFPTYQVIEKRDPSPLFVGLPQEKGKHLLSQYQTRAIVLDRLLEKRPIVDAKVTSIGNKIFYITSSYCLLALEQSNFYNGDEIWSAGVKTMFSLFKRGYWVHGSASLMGESELVELSSSMFLSLFKGKHLPCYFFSHSKAQTSLGKIVPCYEHKIVPTTLIDHDLSNVKIFYWTSFTQYKIYKEHFPEIIDNPESFHACGLGKTFKRMREAGVMVTPFFSIEDFLERFQLS
ncbi:MAG: hydroxymethylbilane synthase [Oligoflexia bacterium]|nr:hydroxymethylbilane synthase [Oligoflexia bacterium]MBF0366753.1 hydroxymethylbilane synthase [Oligoflexia bacterium]